MKTSVMVRKYMCDSAGYDDNDNVIMNNGEGWFKDNVIEREII